MAIEVKLPTIGEGVESGDVLEVYVQEGDVISKDQDLIELETDKATMGVPSSHAGKVAKVHVKKGDTVPVGSVLVTLEVAAAESAAAKSNEPPPAAAQPAETPPRGEAQPEPTPVAAREEPAPAPAPPATTPPATTPTTKRTEPAPQAAPAATAVREPAVDGDEPSELAPAGPAIRRFAREVGVDLRNVTGTGEGGRITRDDVLQVVRRASQQANGGATTATRAAPASAAASAASPVAAPAAAPAPASAAKPLPGDGGRDAWGPIRVQKLSRIRKAIAAQMHKSSSTVARVTNFDDADVTELEKIRQASKADYAAAGVKLTAMPFLIKAIAQALRQNPELNASLDLENEQVIYKEYVNIGIAVDTERGLVVPSLRGANELSISEIARELSKIAESARNSSFTLDDLQGSTFTVSNLGAIGGTYSTPIVNVPEVAILLVGRSRKLPVVVDDEIAVRLMMPLSLSYDHRLVDGAAAARFLNDVISFLEAPSRLLLAP